MEKERGFGMWSECTSWNSKPFLRCQAPLTTGESGKQGRCAPSSARCGTPRSNFAAVCRALGSVEPEQLAGYGRSRGITDRCTARLCQQSLFPRLSLFSPFFPTCQLICCLFLPTLLPVACTRYLCKELSSYSIGLLRPVPLPQSLAHLLFAGLQLAAQIQER